MEKCPICSNDIKYSSLGSRDAYSVSCPQCGNYRITRTALVNLRSTDLTSRQRGNISGWLIENESYEINSANLDDYLVKLKPPPFIERADNLLIYIAHKAEHVGGIILFDDYFISKSWCINDLELKAILDYLQETKRIYFASILEIEDREYAVTPQGWIRLEELSKSTTASSQGFVAMWFSDEIRPLYDEAIAPAIIDAGYMPHRVDLREHNDKIDDEIISQIRRSKFVVADFTGHRGGVYFEAGFAKGLGLEVFWLCNEDDLENIHFDIRQYNCITWSESNKEDLRKRLALRIESVLGAGSGS